VKSRRLLLSLVLLVVALASFPAHAQNNPKPPVTPGDPRAVYIVVLNHEKGPEPDFANGGAKQLARWSNRVVVELPPAALDAMLKHGRVKYVQHLITGPVTSASAATSEKPASASLVAKTMTGGGTLQWSTGDYHYDGSGNIDRIGADSGGQTRRFVYDELERLVQAGLEAPAAAPGTYTNYSNYTYDSFGNRLSEQTPTMNETVVADKNTNRVTLPGTTVTYDGVGNMTAGGGLSYQYDPFNNLKEVDGWYSATQKMAIYNADDERIIFCGDGSIGPCRWTLRGNGNEVLREYESGAIGNGNYPSYYLWVEDSVYRDNLLAGAQRETAEGGRLHFHLDHLGSPRLTTNATGQKVTANEFAPFGRELTSITQEAQLGYDRTETHRFTGHERDFVEGTGSDTVNFIDYMHARSYTQVFGRFLTVDPLLGDFRSPQTWNRYAYAGNNPINVTDPTGRCEQQLDKPPCSDGEITVTAKNPSDEEHFLFLMNETQELDLPFMGDWSSAHLFPNYLWSSYQTKQQEKLAGHPVTVGEGVVLMGMALVGGPESAVNATRLSNQLTAEEIAGGHAFDKHVIELGEFPGVTTRSEFAAHIEQRLSNAEVKNLSNGRVAYWDNATQTVVIRNPHAVDGGTAFKPKQGRSYFDNLR
jgi:filamentous hemagglutinin